MFLYEHCKRERKNQTKETDTIPLCYIDCARGSWENKQQTFWWFDSSLHDVRYMYTMKYQFTIYGMYWYIIDMAFNCTVARYTLAG